MEQATGISAPRRTPPSIVEILTLPVIGVIAVDLFHTQANELILFFIPFVVVVFRLAIAQFQTPPLPQDPTLKSYVRASRNCIALNQLAAFLLMLLECGGVIAVNPTVPAEVWIFLGALYAAYVAMRLVSRFYWARAATIVEGEFMPTR